MTELSDLDLLNALGVEAKVKKKAKLSPREERLVAGFEEILAFVDRENRVPVSNDQADIFERLYATRLERIRKLPEAAELLSELDRHALLNRQSDASEGDELDDIELLAQLGVEKKTKDDITELKHVRSSAEKDRAKADEVGTRRPCKDFEQFKRIFESVQSDLDSGRRKTIKFIKDGTIEEGNFFILGGQKVYVASIGDAFKGKDGRNEYRLRVIFDNGVESDQLMRSLQKRLWEDETGRRITDLGYGPLFDDAVEEKDIASGTVYVLRSKLDHPVLNDRREVVHKIGITGGDVKTRIANAKSDPTYLMADVEVVRTYELFNINRKKLETLIHRFFAAAQMNIEIKDRFGKPVAPREWFLVPLFVIDEVIEKIQDGTLANYKYDTSSASLKLS